MKRTYAWLLVVMLLCSTVIFAQAASDTGGTCGEALAWALDDAGTLTISGTGAMEDYTSTNSTPWYGVKNKIKAIVIENGVTVIGQAAFVYIPNLTAVTIPATVNAIGYAAFNSCDNLKDVYYGGSSYLWNRITIDELNECLTTAAIHCDTQLPGTSQEISEKAYLYTVDNGVATITGYTEYLGGTITIPTVLGGYPVAAIGDGALSSCNSLIGVTIPGTVTIGREAFWGCENLKFVTIGDGTVTVAAYAFYRCTELTEVTFPKDVTSIEEGAFSFCANLTDVYYGGTESQWEAVAIGGSNKYLNNATIHYAKAEETVGDLDGVEGVNEGDAIYLLKYILIPDQFRIVQPADFDKSGNVDEEDVIYLLQHVLMPNQFPL